MKGIVTDMKRVNGIARVFAAATLLWVAADSRLGAAGDADAQPPTQAPASIAIEVSDIALVKKWGIRVESMRLTAAGYMLDFRYRVVDARKAKPLFERKTKPVLRDDATGAEMSVPVPPKTGALRNSNEPQAGRSYFMFFANPGRFVKPGRLVTVTIGAFRVSGIRVDAESAPNGAAAP